MYRYDQYDRTLVTQRVGEFRSQVARRLAGELSEDQFRPLRLMNGVYLQLHAYMLRVAIPYGTLSARQMRKLAQVARVYDKGYGHVTTRQNIQFNWPKLQDVPDILHDLALVDMHAIQTSGNCVRNVTTDPFAGVAADEIADPRIHAELIRQWSTGHPEFSFLPRKFKVAVTGSPADRAATRFHDIGLKLVRNGAGEVGFAVSVGGGQGRTPLIGHIVRAFLPKDELLAYLEAILRVYNRFGRRDNKWKARIKVLVHAIGGDAFAALVEEEYRAARSGAAIFAAEESARIGEHFALPYPPGPEAAVAAAAEAVAAALATEPGFVRWHAANVAAHKYADRAIVTIPLKRPDGTPGDISAERMDAVAGIAERFSHAEIRISHEQNLVLPHVRRTLLPLLWRTLEALDLAGPIAGLASDVISCPGMDYCALATARSIPIARAIGQTFAELEALHHIGPLRINLSGCVNACGHHHVGHIGILGLDKRGREAYQITVGGDPGAEPALGTLAGPAVAGDRVAPVIERIIAVYLGLRRDRAETFSETVRRVGVEPFREVVHAVDPQ